MRLLVADDHPTFVRAVGALLADVDDIDVVGTASTGDQAVRAALDLQPDVVLMDLQMPGMNGIDATARLAADAPHIAVLVLTMFEDDDSVVSAIRAGARGYLLKGARKEEILRALRAVHGGDAIFGGALARRLGVLVDPQRHQRPFPDLTDREHDVLDALASGAANVEIARRLGLSDKTVRNYVSTVLTKLQVETRAEAIVLARDRGLGR